MDRRIASFFVSAVLATGGACCFGGGGTGLAGRWIAYEHPDRSTTIQSTLVLEGSDASGTFELVRVETPRDGCVARTEIHGTYRASNGELFLGQTFSSFEHPEGCMVASSPPSSEELHAFTGRFEGPMTVSSRDLRCRDMLLHRSLL